MQTLSRGLEAARTSEGFEGIWILPLSPKNLKKWTGIMWNNETSTLEHTWMAGTGTQEEPPSLMRWSGRRNLLSWGTYQKALARRKKKGEGMVGTKAADSRTLPSASRKNKFSSGTKFRHTCNPNLDLTEDLDSCKAKTRTRKLFTYCEKLFPTCRKHK
ncbi:hypothetical protein CYMTET_55011 [Cymbomonas tetramitiformis]|uniref:Uncharacterized protein n=1 Tax=Cymbomonas tetramitiformis TaxID=36881 RepID=A0AAE0BDS6_9CHLO|nr:hypothetical protein CYMTET_55011 [Cymbomonas tetramitiformis]